MKKKRKKEKINFWKILSTLTYSAIAVFSLLIILSSFKIGGYRMFAVKSGSMAPAVKQGSIVFDTEAEEYVVGDIITYQISNGKDTMTHRIVEVREENGNTYYQLKGDANPAPDTDKVYQSDVVGRVYITIPLVGYLVSFLRTLPGLIIFIIIPATIIIYEEINKIREEVKRINKKGRKTTKNGTNTNRESLIISHCNKIKKWMDNNRKEATKREEAENV